ncbi:hypothetical protein AMS68_005018 [Peltaster fructicola]|uniref:Bax inhibitor 1 n=1 Tax=Peltaster fructicola TaxID=286661 RepID=A0A6H0XXV8_9PEZI|nr:hypothetical protein AMS68_005018 [Peltaster fructicola]
MASLAKRPFALTSVLRQLSKPSQIHFRCFQTHSRAPVPQSFIKAASPLRASFQGHQTVFRQAFKQSSRSYQTSTPTNPLAQGNLTQRLIYGGAIFGGTLVLANFIFNQDGRDDGGMPPFERQYLNQTFLHTAMGVGIIAIAARALHVNGWSYRLMAANPWLVLGIGLVGSIGSMMICYNTSPDNYMVKYGSWAAFNVTQAALLSPMLFFNPAILARAGLYTVGVMGSIALVGATAKQDKYLYLGGPLLAGVAVVALSGLAPLVLPATATRALLFTENLWLYGGLAVFAGFTLYDVQKILHHARMAQAGRMRADVVNESISLELDFINIFVRMVQILAMSQNRRK